jgi:hypothetical protein
MTTPDRELSGGERMALPVSQIHMASKTLLLLFGTRKSETLRGSLPQMNADHFIVIFSKSAYLVSRILRVTMEKVSKRHISTLTIPLRFVASCHLENP